MKLSIKDRIIRRLGGVPQHELEPVRFRRIGENELMLEYPQYPLGNDTPCIHCGRPMGETRNEEGDEPVHWVCQFGEAWCIENGFELDGPALAAPCPLCDKPLDPTIEHCSPGTHGQTHEACCVEAGFHEETK